MIPMPHCEALAADPARYLFKSYLRELLRATSYERQNEIAGWCGGYLCALLELDVIDCDRHRALGREIRAFVWGDVQ